ncbi:unnamed protein product [Mycena citricolor]|uniref:BTB domain-containing protein n=1 Tax=Mycena citricolor TaxID=2018698 RepID=A0AAD2H314_9AGAR|nr:unnamed protein product [Mycena citricolor]CAK5269373.1 unnamed protein product [Mycena citricolor]
MAVSDYFWFDDGSLILEIQSKRFKIHRTLLTRHSPYISSLLQNAVPTMAEPQAVVIDASRDTSAEDFEVLLQHLYHDFPVTVETPFPRIAAIVRITSPGQLHFPSLHDVSLRYFASLFPSGPTPFVHPHPLEEALDLATAFEVTSIRKGLYYSLMTSTDFDTGPASSDFVTHSGTESDTQALSAVAESAELPGKVPLDIYRHTLSAKDAQVCMHLMTQFIEYFTPVLFTPPATAHMACTDVFADTWLRLVIEPALGNEGVYKPLETLENIKHIDWAKHGLCEVCVVDKIAEWSEEQHTIWRLMDGWLHA